MMKVSSDPIDVVLVAAVPSCCRTTGSTAEVDAPDTRAARTYRLSHLEGQRRTGVGGLRCHAAQGAGAARAAAIGRPWRLAPCCRGDHRRRRAAGVYRSPNRVKVKAAGDLA
ncbi:MAG: hypothetical protein ACLSVD_10205 [Eggerthellaceae bacterium]